MTLMEKFKAIHGHTVPLKITQYLIIQEFLVLLMSGECRSFWNASIIIVALVQDQNYFPIKINNHEKYHQH